MAYTKVNLREVEDMAPRLGYAPNVEARYAEEVYFVVSGSARIKAGDEVVELGPFDALRQPPGTPRGMQAGPEGVEIVAFGAPNTENKDTELLPGWWQD